MGRGLDVMTWRLTKYNKHGQPCSNGRTTRQMILERCAEFERSGLTPAEVTELKIEIKRLKSLLNKAIADLAVECCTCIYQDSELCKNCNNCSRGQGNECLWEWRGAKVEVEKQW